MSAATTALAISLDETAGESRAAAPVPPRAARPAPLHIPSLDGLRAVSFLIVFFAHSGLDMFVPAIPGGFGVTVFFFLSGYLITTLMRVEHQATGRVNIRNFYMRRALRILPPFYLILGLAALLTVIGALPGTLRTGSVLAQALHVSNYWFIFRGADGTPPGTIPYWSLAVEEHFYLLFPMIYIGLSRYLSRRGQAGAIVALCLAACAWRCFLVLGMGVTENRTYMASDTRFDSILLGCALAIGMNPVIDRPVGHERVWKWLLLPAGLALLMVTFLYRAPWFRETIRYSLQGGALAAVFVAAIRFPTWLPFRVLNTKPVAFIGVLSYSLYLSHQAAILWVDYWLTSLTRAQAAAASLAIAFAVSLAIHYFVEKPFARLRQRFARTRPVAQVAAVR